MKVLWFVATPPLSYGNSTYVLGGWRAALEKIVKEKLPNIELGLAFEHPDQIFKTTKDGVVYYPMSVNKSKILKISSDGNKEWAQLKPHCIKAIDDFKPDIIQVFGSEWSFGLLALDVNIPIVVHMQGFINVYSPSSKMAMSFSDILKYKRYNPISITKYLLQNKRSSVRMEIEKIIMASNRYFMGRTDWDKSIVKYYSPNSTYFHCEEAIRDVIKESSVRWKFRKSPKMRIITISSASSLKGNEIILRTAKLLKDFGFDFEWRVAGNIKSFEQFEDKCGINHKDVNIETIGFIDADRVAKELSEAQVYVHTAIIDNSPNSLCEAQLIGCPVVSANVGGIPQLVEDGVSGILYPHNEFHRLAFHLMSLHNDKERLESLSKAELKQSHDRHNQKMIADCVYIIYNDIIKSHIK